MGPVTLAQIAEVLGVTKNAVLRRSKREGWAFRTEPVRGGRAHVFEIHSIPGHIRMKVQARLAIEAVKSAATKAEQSIPDVFTLVVDQEVFEVRRISK